MIATEDWDNGKFPDDFQENLFTHYRDYLDDKGNVILGRGKNLEAYIYFVDRILTSVNSHLNQYNPAIRKTRKLSKIFNVSDEAYALAAIENYIESWIRKKMAAESRQAEKMGLQATTEDDDVPPHERPAAWFRAKWSSSRDGNKCTGWDDEGIDRHGEHAKAIMKLRDCRTTGALLDNYMIRHWLGTLHTKCKKKASKLTMKKAWSMPDELDTKYAQV